MTFEEWYEKFLNDPERSLDLNNPDIKAAMLIAYEEGYNAGLRDS